MADDKCREAVERSKKSESFSHLIFFFLVMSSNTLYLSAKFSTSFLRILRFLTFIYFSSEHCSRYFFVDLFSHFFPSVTHPTYVLNTKLNFTTVNSYYIIIHQNKYLNKTFFLFFTKIFTLDS